MVFDMMFLVIIKLYFQIFLVMYFVWILDNDLQDCIKVLFFDE